jgi:hypothetical protein
MVLSALCAQIGKSDLRAIFFLRRFRAWGMPKAPFFFFRRCLRAVLGMHPSLLRFSRENRILAGWWAFLGRKGRVFRFFLGVALCNERR